MKRKLTWLGAILSGLYLLTVGIMPDPLPFVDEAIALAVFLKCTSALGYDLRKWLPFLGKNAKSKPSENPKNDKDVTIDV